MNNQCVSGFGRTFTLRAVSATFPSQNFNTNPASTWDFGGGAPDPFVCLYVDSSTTALSCSGPPGVADTFAATWNKSWTVVVNAATKVEVRAFDEDTTTHDFMDGFVLPTGSAIVASARAGGFSGAAYTGDPVTWSFAVTVQ